MCGILGAVQIQGKPLQTDQLTLLDMRDKMQDRGPDAAGLKWINSSVCLAHRRLSIRDIEHGQQPWSSPDGRWHLTYNGEIYNTAELERKLQQAGFPPPVSHCDTETLGRWLQFKGIAAAQDLRGMFAFAAYDSQEQRLLLVRDRCGVKPLYYTQTNGEFLFASSPAALLKHPEVSREVDSQGLVHYLLTLRTGLDSSTLFRDIHSLPPGHQLEIRNANISVIRYWDYPDSGPVVCLPGLSALLGDAVKARLVSDVPVGMLLSGGVDSALLASLVKQNLGCSFVVECGIGDHPDQQTEADLAAATARQLQLNYSEVRVTQQRYRKIWRKLIASSGLPTATPSDPIIYALAESLKQKVGVVLGGEGADELFAGYTGILGIGWAVDRLALTTEPTQLLNRYFETATVIPPAALAILLKEVDVQQEQRKIRQTYLKNMTGSTGQNYSGLMQMKRLLHRVNLESLLLRLDQATMAAGLEARVPFTDHLFIEQTWNLPDEQLWRLEAGNDQVSTAVELEQQGLLETKAVLRDLARQRLPTEIATRRKASFPTPVPEWLKQDWSDWVSSQLRESKFLQHHLNEQPLQELADHPEQAGFWLWPLINLAIWAEEFSVQ